VDEWFDLARAIIHMLFEIYKKIKKSSYTIDPIIRNRSINIAVHILP